MIKHLKRCSIIAAAIGVLIFSACSTVTIRDKGTMKLASEPSYESSEAFFLWGIVGEKHINVTQICGKRQVKQIQSQRTFADGFLSAITFGIYAPRTVKVWCEGVEEA